MRTRFSIAAGLLAATALTVSACSAGVVDSQNSVGDPQPVDCQPTYPSSEQGTSSYYSVVVQLMNCQSSPIPLSVDVDSKAGKGSNLSAVGGVNASGTSVIWDNGSGTAEGTPTTVPAGNGQGGFGGLVGLTTVPYWNGQAGDSSGPYDSRLSKNNNLKPNFSGDWTIYGPSSMINLEVFTSLPWPYNPDYSQSSNPIQQPGSVATGTFLYRTQLGGGQIPIYTSSSSIENGYGSTPPDSSFVPGACWDPMVLKNGGNADSALPTPNPAPSPANLNVASDWSYQGSTTLGGTIPAVYWANTLAGNNFGQLAKSFNYPVVMLANGDVNTQGGLATDSSVPLRSPANQTRSVTPHYVKAYYRVMSGISCSGSSAKLNHAVVIGGDLSGINMAKASIKDVTFANSDLSGADLDSAVFGNSNLAYTNLSGANLYNTDLSGVNLTGANLSNLTHASYLSLANAQLLNTNLSGITPTQWQTMNLTGTQFCNTIEPGNTTPTNSDCNSLLRAQNTDWSNVTPGNSCVSNPSQTSDCIFVSLYNNTENTLGLGAASCSAGRTAQLNGSSAPAFVSPLDTARWSWEITPGQSADSSGNTISCDQTYANGANGKIQFRATSTGTSATLNADSGYCMSGGQCLPLSADGKTPVVVNVVPDTNRNSAGTGNYYNVVICDASQITPGTVSKNFPQGQCPTTAALPGSSGASPSSTPTSSAAVESKKGSQR